MRIFDVQRSLWIRIGGTIRGPHVRLYDYDREGIVHGDLPDVIDFCAGITFKLLLNGTHFCVRSATPARELQGRVVGADIELCDASGVIDRYRLEATA